MLTMRSKVKVFLTIFLWLILVVSTAAAENAATSRPLRVLILSGRNNHNWKATTPALKEIYEDSGRFVVDVTNDPSSCDAGTFARYDVIVSNWSAWPDPDRQWGEETEEAFLEFVRNGGGFVLFHAASATFDDWAEFQQLIGASYIKGTTGHGRIHAFKVTIVDRDHPVTRGINDFWITDELWHRMGMRPTAHVLATAFSAEHTGGTGSDELAAVCTTFGDGRCFNFVLGHDVAAMRSLGWKMLMLRGTEWAATGAVSIETPIDMDAGLRAIAAYKYGQSRDALAKLEELVHFVAPKPALRKQAASKLAAMLGSDTTVGCKKFLCRQLGLIGSGLEVPALARLLDDKELSFAARAALERIPGAEAAAVLRAVRD
jgi:type 1 glutamine amidotransferase